MSTTVFNKIVMKEIMPEDHDDWRDVEPDEDMWKHYYDQYGIDFAERSVTQQIKLYIPPFILVISTVGNILATIVLWKFIHKVLSTCLYLFVGQIMDLVVIYILCGNEWLALISGLDVRKIATGTNNSVCKIYPFVTDLAMHLAMWMTAAMSVETTLVLMKPQRLMRFCRMERVRAVILLILVLLICVNAHCFWTYALSDDEKNTDEEIICTMMRQGNNQRSDDFRRIAWPLIDFIVKDFFPYFIIFACTVTQLTVRIKKKENLRQLENTWKAYSVDSTAARELQISFLALCLSHLLLLLPKMACDIFNYLVQPTKLLLVSYSFRLDAKRILAEGLGNLLLYVYLSMKFFVLLGCCKAFRTEIWSLLTCFSCKSNRRRPVPVNRNQQIPLVTRQPLSNPSQPLLNQTSVDPSPSSINQTQPMISPAQPLLSPNNQEASQENSLCPNPRRVFSMTSV